ncbi:MAG: O-antigen ligase family protein [Nostocaceae cyanobacterium]|nr:O-antigen ligase family protein [Nostocaceae cyanobacterium]
MKQQSISNFLRTIEPGIVILLLLLFPADVDLPPLIRKGVNIFAYLITVPLVIGCGKRFLYVVTRDWTLLILLALALASYFWSVAVDQTSMMLTALLRTMMLGAYLATRYTPKEQTQLFTKVFILSGILSYAAILLLPSYGIKFTDEGEVGWSGIYTFKNGLGSIMNLGATLALLNAFFNRKHRLILLIGFGLALILIVFSKSSTSLVSLLCASMLLPLYKVMRQHYKLRIILYGAVLICSICIFIFILHNADGIFTKFLGKEATLTGRLPLWGGIMDVASERPWFGYGYGKAFWNSIYGIEAVKRNPLRWPPANSDLSQFHSHNGFLELFTELGWLGCALFLINLVIVLYRVISLASLTKSKENFWLLQVITIMIIFNFTEACTILEANQLMWILYVSISLSTAIQKERIQREYRLSKAVILETSPSL